MADTSIPGEWQFINTLTAPPASGQARLNNLTQTAATKLWISKTPATGGDVSALLAQVKQGQELSITNKANSSKWQVYVVSGSPVDNAGYTEFPITWRRGGSTIPEQRLYLAVVSTNVTANATGQQIAASTGPVTVSTKQGVVVDVVMSTCARVQAGRLDISGQLMTREFAYPFQGKNYTSPGMTLRQYYVGQAITGFLASGGPIGNLIGKGAAYCFQVANSMIEYEAKQFGPPAFNLPPVPSAAPPQAAPPQSAPPTVPLEEALAIQERQSKEAAE